MSFERRRLAAAAIFMLAPVGLLLARFTWGMDVPDPLPTHWDAQGQVDGTIGASTFFWICLVLSAGLALIGLASALSGRLGRSSQLVGGAAFGAWLLAAVYAEVVYVARGAADANDVRLPWQAAVSMFVVGVGAAVAVVALLPRSHPKDDAMTGVAFRGWFRSNGTGLGVQPQTWQGWVLTLVVTAVVIVLAVLLGH